MNLEEINKKFFAFGTRGYKITSNFYNKYSDLFKKTLYQSFKEFSNQIFLNISNIDFSKDIRNEEAYIIGTIKIQCRVLLDKAIKSKKIIPESQLNELQNKEPEESVINQRTVNKKIELLNHLIDEKSRYEIAGEINININTLDTHIRRLRIKFSKFLIKLGYTDQILEKYNNR